MEWILRKTRTESHAAAPQNAFCTVAAVQLSVQLLLWVTFWGYDRAHQAVWQAALVQILPILLLWFVYRKTGAHWALLPCLVLDAAFILHTLGGLLDALLPEYPYGLGAAVCAAAAYLSLVLAKPRGVAYGTSALKWPLILCFLLGTVLLRSSNRADRLWPVLGSGVGPTALAALQGTGAAWGAALSGKSKRKWVLIPWAVGCIWALWYGFLRPWSPGDALGVGEKMMGLARHAGSVVNFQLAGLLWLIAQPVALIGSALCGETSLPKRMPRLARCAVVIVPAYALSRFEWLAPLMPWRGLWALAVGLVLLILQRKGRMP